MASPYWDRAEHVYKLGLPRAQQDLMLYLVHRADFETWRCDPSIDTIVRDTKLNRRTFLTARAALRTANLISWIQRRHNGTNYETVEYIILPGGRCKTAPKGVGAKLHHKPTTVRAQRTVPCTTCGVLMRTRKDPSEAVCRSCLQQQAADRQATPANVVSMFPEGRT